MDDRSAAKGKALLSFAVDLGVDSAEVYLRSALSTTVEVKDQAVEAFDRAREVGAGLRVFAEGRSGFAFSTDLSDKALHQLADAAVTNARSTDPDPFLALPDVFPPTHKNLNIFDPVLAALDDQEKIARVMAMEREAFGVDPRIRRIRKASARFSSSMTVLMSTSGANVEYRGTAGYASMEAVAEADGESQAGWEFDAHRFYDRLNIEEVGRKAAQHALDLLGARSIPSVKAPVVLDPLTGGELLSLLVSGLSAENVQKKKSLLAGKLGQIVISPLLTVYDDGLLDAGFGTAPCDDEGVPVRTKKVIDGGRLAMFLYNSYTARTEGTSSTGNGIRAGFRGVPGVGVTNCYIEPGKGSCQDLVRDTEKGLYVIELLGAHTANPVSGDFSVGATGFWIEKGRIVHPVREVTLAGNILELMQNVDAVGGDLRFSGRIGSPSLRVKELSIGGK
ncbi:MAG: hypothetical protein A2X56_14130 [Nitrospirae bacterium GWC2_57_13]|nr:MAG: hypothetical protein A2072_06360 [Nitrospirae bacterium GWC1_57_7]OGW28569.1 MAG: hypothetical protein A2X56_14130 [Nitrospirae bacterium GWC2_57_13]HAR44910.1 TldD/PmbA family protein [Nitrospiraceae bacterium]